jgi:hypothetical protein
MVVTTWNLLTILNGWGDNLKIFPWSTSLDTRTEWFVSLWIQKFLYVWWISHYNSCVVFTHQSIIIGIYIQDLSPHQCAETQDAASRSCSKEASCDVHHMRYISCEQACPQTSRKFLFMDFKYLCQLLSDSEKLYIVLYKYIFLA